MREAGFNSWIILNPFDKTDSSAIIDEVRNNPDKNVTGLIFETNQIISTNQTYAWPQIMSEASYNTVDNFKQYSVNINPGYIATYTHTFIENCWVLDPVVPTYYAYGGLWALITIVYTVWLYCMPLQERLSIQKSSIMLPLLKCMEVFLEGGYLSYCPFYSVSNNGLQYMQMARISIITITYTVFLSYLYLICKGWQTTISQLSRNQATNLTMIMGGVYLMYSAFFLSIDFYTIFIIMNVCMVLLYAGLGYVYARNCIENYHNCSHYL
jgi:hypothetical protein